MDIKIRDFVSDDAEAVDAVAMKAWRVTYRDIYDATFIERYVNTFMHQSKLHSWKGASGKVKFFSRLQRTRQE